MNKLIDKSMKRVVKVELSIIFLSTTASIALRFNLNFDELVNEIESQFQLLAYPFLWCFFMYTRSAWEKTKLLHSDLYISSVFAAGWQTLLAFSAFAYLIKFPISRLWVLSATTLITFLLIAFRYLTRRHVSKQTESIQSNKYLYIGDPLNKLIHLQEFDSVFGFTPNIIDFDMQDIDSADVFLSKYQSCISKYNIFGVLVESKVLQNTEYLKLVADSRKDHVTDVILLSSMAPLLKRLEILENPKLIRIRENQIVASGAIVKRIFDILFSFIFLVLLSPIMLLVALVVKISSRGPIFYLDERLGQNGKPFMFPKFRTMFKNADEMRLDILGRPDAEMAHRYKADPRITSAGKFLRRWSLDELPQLWSVLIGDMSIVGPRPVLRQEDVQISENHRLRFLAKPGLTGLWQVSGRKELMWEERMLRDITYIDNWSLSYDVTLILKTFSAILKGDGAY